MTEIQILFGNWVNDQVKKKLAYSINYPRKLGVSFKIKLNRYDRLQLITITLKLIKYSMLKLKNNTAIY